MIAIQIQDERGQVLETFEDPRAVYDILPPAGDREGCCLRFIDPYGDTTFNQAQVTELLSEINSRLEGVAPEAQVRVLKLVRFIEQAVNQVHLYLKFVGD